VFLRQKGANAKEENGASSSLKTTFAGILTGAAETTSYDKKASRYGWLSLSKI
jgi:hypothetical protein